MDADIRKDIWKVCYKMGVPDERTARKHLSRFDACLNDFVISLANIISQCGNHLPERKPEISCISDVNRKWFRELSLRIISIRERLFGFENISPEDIAALFNFFVHPAYPCATMPVHSGNKSTPCLRSPPDDE